MYLRKSSITFQQYLEAYERRWNINPKRPLRLLEYEDRTLFTTWNVTYAKLKEDDPIAANVLQLLAYFSPQHIWYDLIHAGLAAESVPWLSIELPWLYDFCAERIDFENVMATLVEYCMMEAHSATESYMLHNCVHDWTLYELNQTPDARLYWYAIHCVRSCVQSEGFARLQKEVCYKYAEHGAQLVHQHLEPCDLPEPTPNELIVFVNKFAQLSALGVIGRLLAEQWFTDAAIRILSIALRQEQKRQYPDHDRADQISCLIALQYFRQHKGVEAAQMMEQVLASQRERYGPEDTIVVVETCCDLARVYASLGKSTQAEQTSIRALTGIQKHNPHSILTLTVPSLLGKVQLSLGKVKEAENTFIQLCLKLDDEVLFHFPELLLTFARLGELYANQGRHEDARQQYSKVLEVCERIDNSEDRHVSTYQWRSEALYARDIHLSNGAPPRSALIQLLHMAQTKTKRDYLVVWDYLGLALLHFDDEQNARLAFMYGFSSSIMFSCNGCGQENTVNTGLHVCRRCLQTVLCYECMKKYKVKDRYLPLCVNHVFFDA